MSHTITTFTACIGDDCASRLLTKKGNVAMSGAMTDWRHVEDTRQSDERGFSAEDARVKIIAEYHHRTVNLCAAAVQLREACEDLADEFEADCRGTIEHFGCNYDPGDDDELGHLRDCANDANEIIARLNRGEWRCGDIPAQMQVMDAATWDRTVYRGRW